MSKLLVSWTVPLLKLFLIEFHHNNTTQAGQLAKRFAQDRGMYKFPTFEADPNIMDGMEIFWKEESDEE